MDAQRRLEDKLCLLECLCSFVATCISFGNSFTFVIVFNLGLTESAESIKIMYCTCACL